MSLLTPFVQLVITVARAMIGTAFSAVITVIAAFPTVSKSAAIIAMTYPIIRPSARPISATIKVSVRFPKILSLFEMIILSILLG